MINKLKLHKIHLDGSYENEFFDKINEIIDYINNKESYENILIDNMTFTDLPAKHELIRHKTTDDYVKEKVENINVDDVFIAEKKNRECKECLWYLEYSTCARCKNYELFERLQKSEKKPDWESRLKEIDYNKLNKAMTDKDGELYAYVTCGEEIKEIINQLVKENKELKKQVKFQNRLNNKINDDYFKRFEKLQQENEKYKKQKKEIK